MPDDDDYYWLSVGHLGEATIEALIERGLIEPDSPFTAVSGFADDWRTFHPTVAGRAAFDAGRDEDGPALEGLASLMGRSHGRDHSPSASDFESLCNLVRLLWIEVIDLRAKVAATGKGEQGGQS